MTQWGLDALFNPGKRHMDDEKRRLQSTREEIGDASKGRRIDLEAGKVSIRVPRPAAVEPDEVIDDDTALAPALAAEDVPAVALANDEAEIVPDLVDDTAVDDTAVDDTAVDEPVDEELVVAEPVVAEPVVEELAVEEAVDDVPIVAPVPEPVTAAPRRKQLSASAWSRRG